MSTGGQTVRLSTTSPGASAVIVALLVLGVYLAVSASSGKRQPIDPVQAPGNISGPPVTMAPTGPPAPIPPSTVNVPSSQPAPPQPTTTSTRASPPAELRAEPVPPPSSSPTTPITPRPPARDDGRPPSPAPSARDDPLRSDERTRPRPPPEFKFQEIKVNSNNAKMFSAETFPHPPEIIKLLKHAEVIASVHPYSTKPEHKSLIEKSEKMQYTNLGPIPAFCIKAIKAIGGRMTDKQIQSLKDHIDMRQAFGAKGHKQFKHEGSRSWKSFLNRIGAKKDLTGTELALGWFNDTYRCVARGKRMSYFPGVPLEGAGETIGPLFGWLEHLANLTGRQRVLSIDGLDLSGLAIRMRCEKEADKSYRVDLTFWLWGEEGCGETEKEWAMRMYQSSRAVEGAWGRLFDYLQEDLIRRRIVFRPGWSLKSITADDGYGRPRLEHESRSVRIETFDTDKDLYAQARPETQVMLNMVVGKAMRQIRPTEIVFLNVRQYNWDPKLKRENNIISVPNMAAALNSCGPEPLPAAQAFVGGTVDHTEAETVVNLATLKGVYFLDLGGFLPLISSDHHFLDLKWWPGLREIYIPYVASKMGKKRKGSIPSEQALGGTARMLLDELSPLAKFLSPATNSEGRTPGLVYIGMGSTSPSKLADDLDAYLKLMIKAIGKQKGYEESCRRYKDLSDRHLANIWMWEMSSGSKRTQIKPTVTFDPAAYK